MSILCCQKAFIIIQCTILNNVKKNADLAEVGTPNGLDTACDGVAAGIKLNDHSSLLYRVQVTVAGFG